MVFEKISSLIAEKVGCDTDTLALDTKFADLGIDSLDVTELVMNIEDEFSIEIEVDSSLATIGDLVTLVESKLG
jgi:acyl carrier protein